MQRATTSTEDGCGERSFGVELVRLYAPFPKTEPPPRALYAVCLRAHLESRLNLGLRQDFIETIAIERGRRLHNTLQLFYNHGANKATHRVGLPTRHAHYLAPGRAARLAQ